MVGRAAEFNLLERARIFLRLRLRRRTRFLCHLSRLRGREPDEGQDC